MSDGGLLDLVCGPASPLPETHQRYRLVAHLGSGGQADVYRAVRLCGGRSDGVAGWRAAESGWALAGGDRTAPAAAWHGLAGL